MNIWLLTQAHVRKGSAVAKALMAAGVKPTGMIFEGVRGKPLRDRLVARLANDGLAGRPFAGAASTAPKTPLTEPGPTVAPLPTAAQFAVRHNIRTLSVLDLKSQESLDAIGALKPYLFVHAGAGILRAPLLAIPKLGTVNAHMGVLPEYRGMNVTEWAALEGGPTGCTAHLIDPGIDTGDILSVHEMPGPWPSIAAMRADVDATQLALLAEAVRVIAEANALPPASQQQANEGKQYFAMHADLKAILDRRLAAAYGAVD